MRALHRQSSGSPGARVWSVMSIIGRIVILLTVAVTASTVLTLSWFNVQHQQVLIVSSGSMAPMSNAGDAVTVAHPDPNLVPASAVTGVMTGTIPYLGSWGLP